MEKTNIPTAEWYGAKHLREGVAARVRRLRDLADRIEREAKRDLEIAEAGRGTYSRVVANVAHEVTWGMANLNLDTLLATATDADIAHAENSMSRAATLPPAERAKVIRQERDALVLAWIDGQLNDMAGAEKFLNSRINGLGVETTTGDTTEG